MEKERIIAVLNLIDTDDIDSLEVLDNSRIKINESEYLVLTDEEADEEFRAYQESLWDDLGIESFTEWARQHILANFVDVEWFNNAMRESYKGYVEDIKSEGNRLTEEMEEHNAESEEDYVDILCDAYSDGVEWYKENFGIKELARVIKEQDLVDFDKVVEWVKDTDGRGYHIASYDGEERERDGYYIYQTN